MPLAVVTVEVVVAPPDPTVVTVSVVAVPPEPPASPMNWPKSSEQPAQRTKKEAPRIDES
jgi:hypothetical protein